MNLPVTLRPFAPVELPALVRYWNEAFHDQRNFRPVDETSLRRRVLDCIAFEAGGLILAWSERSGHPGTEEIIGGVHAFRPGGAGSATGWSGMQPHHAIAWLHVLPDARRQGIGTRLLQAAERWLYYCPITFGGFDQPCYNRLEHFEAPLFGSSERMGLNARQADLIQFLARRNYKSFDPGDVSMVRPLDAGILPRPEPPAALAEAGLRLVRPQPGARLGNGDWLPAPRFERSDEAGSLYDALLIMGETPTGASRVAGSIVWHPTVPGRVAITEVWIHQEFRGRGFGSLLVDSALHAISTRTGFAAGAVEVELATNLVDSPRAQKLYRSRGFEVTDMWVNLQKT